MTGGRPAAAHHSGQPLYDVSQPFRLGVQFLGRRSAFLGVGRRFLCHLFHLRDRFGDLIQAAGLFLAAQADFVDSRPDPGGNGHIGLHGFAGLISLQFALTGLLHRLLDQAGSISGRLRATLRQVPDLIRDYREAHTGLPGPRRFYRRIQSQDVGLEGDLIDDLQELFNLASN